MLAFVIWERCQIVSKITLFCKTIVLKHYARLIRKHLCCNLFFEKVVSAKSLTSLKQNFVFLWISRTLVFFFMNLVIIGDLVIRKFSRIHEKDFAISALLYKTFSLLVLNIKLLEIKLLPFFSFFRNIVQVFTVKNYIS